MCPYVNYMNNIAIYDSYKLLGLKVGASEDEVKRAWMFYVQTFHPDRLAHNPSLQQEAENKLKEINAAYDSIKEHMEAGKRDHADQTTVAEPAVDDPYSTAKTSPKKEPSEGRTSGPQRGPSAREVRADDDHNRSQQKRSQPEQPKQEGTHPKKPTKNNPVLRLVKKIDDSFGLLVVLSIIAVVLYFWKDKVLVYYLADLKELNVVPAVTTVFAFVCVWVIVDTFKRFTQLLIIVGLLWTAGYYGYAILF